MDFWSEARREPQLRAEVGPVYASFSVPFVTALADGISTGEFTIRGHVRDVADRMIATIDGTALRTLLGEIEEGRACSLLIDGLCAELGLDQQQSERAHAIARELSASEPRQALSRV